METSYFVLFTILLLTLLFIIVAVVSLLNNKTKSMSSERIREICLFGYLMVAIAIAVFSLFVFDGIKKFYSIFYFISAPCLVWFANKINIRDIHQEKIDKKYKELNELNLEPVNAYVLGFSKDRRFTEEARFYIKFGIKKENGKMQTFKSLDRFIIQDAIYITDNYQSLTIKCSKKSRECLIMVDFSDEQM